MTHADTLLEAIESAWQKRNEAEVERLCANARTAHADDPRVWRVSAEYSVERRRLPDALEWMRKACDLSPDDDEMRLRLAWLLLSAGEHGEALANARQIDAARLDNPQLSDTAGTILTHCERPALALPHFERAVQKAPNNPAMRFNLAMAQRMLGDLDAAEVNLDTVLSARPADGEAHIARSGLRVQTPSRNHLPQLRAALALRPRSSLRIQFALAKELEDLGEYHESFIHLSNANEQYRRQLSYDVTSDVQVLDALRLQHTAERLRIPPRSPESLGPVFVVGLPRSGSTLLETMLARHSQLSAGGELNAFPQAVIDQAFALTGSQVPKLALVEKALSLDADRLARNYRERARHRLPGVGLFTDKQPLNYLYVGLILKALPSARIILVRRNPADTCFAMFKTLFRQGFPFSYSLVELGRYYAVWSRLMAHWESFGSAICSVNYEDLVRSPEETCRKTLAFCGLEWEATCVDPNAARAEVTTASAAQVRRPIYDTSIGLWRRYEKQLRPLTDELDSAGIPYA